MTESREDCRDGDSVFTFLPDFVADSCSCADFFGLAFFVVVDDSDLRLERTLTSDDVTTVSDLLVNFSALLGVPVRAGDFERIRDGLFDFAAVSRLAGDFDRVLRRCSCASTTNMDTDKFIFKLLENTQMVTTKQLHVSRKLSIRVRTIPEIHPTPDTE